MSSLKSFGKPQIHKSYEEAGIALSDTLGDAFEELLNELFITLKIL